MAQAVKQPIQPLNKQHKTVSQSIPSEYYAAKIKAPKPPIIRSMSPDEKLIGDLDEIELPPSLPKHNGINIDKFNSWSMKDDLHPLAYVSKHNNVVNMNNHNNNDNNSNEVKQGIKKMQISGSFTCMQLMGGNNVEQNYNSNNNKNKDDDQYTVESSTPSTFHQHSDQQHDEDMLDVEENKHKKNNHKNNNNDEFNEDNDDLQFGMEF